jgi:hypothetical protein
MAATMTVCCFYVIHEHYARLNTLIDMDLIVQIKVDDALITIAVSLFVRKAHIHCGQMYRITGVMRLAIHLPHTTRTIHAFVSCIQALSDAQKHMEDLRQRLEYGFSFFHGV